MRRFRWRRFKPPVHRQQADGQIERQALIQKLVTMTPLAARAQSMMDKHRGGYLNREARRMELITFNDLFVEVVLTLPKNERVGFADRLYTLMQSYCQKHREPMFRREQFDAIIHGLSREIALFLAAKQNEFDVHMTSRTADGLGVDMQIRAPKSGRYVNIDCKTPSAFRYRVYDLLREGRLSEEDADQALIRGMTPVVNGRGPQKVEIVLLRVSPEEFGEIRDFEFINISLAAKVIEHVISLYGHRDGDFLRFLSEPD